MSEFPRFGRPSGGPLVPPFWTDGTRMRLIAAIAEACAERGYAETSVEDVLALAGSSRRTFYAHFDNREQCFLAAYDVIAADAAALLDDESDDRWDVQLQAQLDRLLTHYADYPHHAHILITEILALGPRGATRHEQTMDMLASRLAGCETWNPAGTLARDDQAQALIGAIGRLMQRRLLGGRAQSLPELSPHLTALAVVQMQS